MDVVEHKSSKLQSFKMLKLFFLLFGLSLIESLLCDAEVDEEVCFVCGLISNGGIVFTKIKPTTHLNFVGPQQHSVMVALRL